MAKSENQKFVWTEPDGTPVSCQEKLKVLNENLEEIQQYCQDALEDAVLMGCDENNVRQIFEQVIGNIKNPYSNNK